MGDGSDTFYQPEPIPRKPARPGQARPLRTPMNGSRPDAHEAIARIMADRRFQDAIRMTAKHPHPGTDDTGDMNAAPQTTASFDLFSPGSQQNQVELPDRYRQMRAISRWQEGEDGKPGRWLTEAELFWRQGAFMADWEDDQPYHGLFKSYFPTYNAMSDRQLRGYFTWRAAVRAGDVHETSLSFAYVYLYELINGIGVADPLDGFRKIESFWQAYRAFAPELDRYAGVWLQDYAVYHGLDPELLASSKTVEFDRALIALRKAGADMSRAAARGRADDMAGNDSQDNGSRIEPFAARVSRGAEGREAGTPAVGSTPRRRKQGESAVPLPPDASREDELFGALDSLSTYRLSNSRLYREEPEALRHVSCAVYMRMSEHHRGQRKKNLLDSWFGEQVALPYTMFGSAVFFEPKRHADAEYELDEIHRYRCERGFWTCERFHGSRSRSPKLGAAMRAVDRSLRAVLDPGHPLKDDGKTPKYLQKFIDREIEAWNTWSAAHAPVHIDIDLSRLAGIRSAAAETREALLIDEEREDDGPSVAIPSTSIEAEAEAPFGDTPKQKLQSDSKTGGHSTGFHAQTQSLPEDSNETVNLLSPEQVAYLRALLDDSRAQAAGISEDLLVDAINGALFDQIGDTVIEYGPDGPQLIEDYRDDVEGILNHE